MIDNGDAPTKVQDLQEQVDPCEGQEAEQVGYARPPKEHRIKKGEKRNPHGRNGKPRPKLPYLDERMTVIIGGRRRKMTRRKFICDALLKQVADGNVPAAKVLIALGSHTENERSQAAAVDMLSPEEEQILQRGMKRAAKGEPEE